MIQPYDKGKNSSVMVWGGFWGREKSDLVRMTRDPEAKRGGYTAASYLGVIEDQLPTIVEPGLTFMQDNAPVHTAKIIKQWLEEMGILVLPWPPYSPDLNPIEHLWRWLKERCYQLEPDLKHMQGSKEEIMDKLYATLERAWHDIPESMLESLVRSMPRRVNAVIKAKGWYTKY